jgi:hypothetical protein
VFLTFATVAFGCFAMVIEQLLVNFINAISALTFSASHNNTEHWF